MGLLDKAKSLIRMGTGKKKKYIKEATNATRNVNKQMEKNPFNAGALGKSIKARNKMLDSIK